MKAYERDQTVAASKRPIIPNPHGSTLQKEAWMRQKQRQRTAEIEGQREAQLLAEAEAQTQRTRIARLQQEIELRTRLLAEAEKEAQLRRSQTHENLQPDLSRPRLRRRVRR
jgi:hypothetical protein